MLAQVMAYWVRLSPCCGLGPGFRFDDRTRLGLLGPRTEPRELGSNPRWAQPTSQGKGDGEEVVIVNRLEPGVGPGKRTKK